MPANDTFFRRQARKLMIKPRLHATTLEDRVVPAISGLAFLDYNANGAFDNGTIANQGGTNINNPAPPGTIATAIDIGQAGVTVNIFNAAGTLVDTQTTAANGTWSSTTGPGAYRVEFTGLAAGFFPGPHGATSGTATQFVLDGAANVNFGVVKPTEYFPTNPLLVTPQYVFGNGNSTNAAILSFPYNAGSGTATATSQDADLPLTHDLAIPANQVGSTWGVGFNRQQQTIYASSFTKRHSNWAPPSGPNGAGGPGFIYRMDVPVAGGTQVTTATTWVNLDGLTATVNGASVTIDTVPAAFDAWASFRINQTTQAYWEVDGGPTSDGNIGWDAVGKVGLGGMAVSDDGQFVYVMNLGDRRLYQIPVLANGNADTANIRGFDLPNVLGATQADVRPFAVEFKDGLVYVGLVNSTGTGINLRGYVYTLNPSTANGTWSANSVVNDGSDNTADGNANGNGFRLDYERGSSYGGEDEFLPWSTTFQMQVATGNGQPVKWPQPMLSSLTFDNNNNIVISIRDRLGDQTGNNIPDRPGDTSLYEGISVGETLMAFAETPGSSTNWLLERNGSSAQPGNPATGFSGSITVFGGTMNYGPNDGEGPLTDPVGNTGIGGEFFGLDFYGTGTHNETSVGASVHVPGFPHIVTTNFDPMPGGQFRTGGTRWFNTSDGNYVKGYQLYLQDQGGRGVPGSTFGKANGLGDLVAVADLPPIEIGNRIFADNDRDGIQDADEPGIAGVNIELRDSGGTLLATAVTAPDGSYYFNSGADPDAANNPTNEKYGLVALAAGKQYIVRIPNTSGGATQVPLKGLVVTQFNVASVPAAGSDQRNSDAQTNGLNADITVTGGAFGQSNHTFDAGFAPGISLGDFVWEDADNNGKFDSGETKLSGIPVRLYLDSNADGVPDTPGTPLAITTTGADGDYLFAGLSPDKYVVEITTPAGYRSSTGNTFDPVNGPYESLLLTNTNTNNEDHGVTVTGDLFSGFVVRTRTLELLGAGLNPDDNGNANLNQDFGIYRAYSLGNRLWNDANNDGLFNNSEVGIDGVTIRLFDLSAFDNKTRDLLPGAVPLVAAVTTANGGFYRFDNLIAGQYVAVATSKVGPLANFVSSTGGTSKSTAFEPPPALQPPASKLDNQDEGTTLTGFFVRTGEITLGPGGTAPTNETNLLPPGNAASQGTVDNQADMTNDFGFYQPLSLGNQVWNDVNNNGLLDGGETGLGSVKVTIFRASDLVTPLESQLTTAAGYYLFTGLGTDSYVVQVDPATLPAGTWLTSTGKNGATSGPFEPGADPNTDLRDGIDRGTFGGLVAQSLPIAISPGNAPPGIPPTPGIPDSALDADSYRIVDFGFYQPLSIGSLVWNDADNDGKLGGGELGIDNVPVTLYADGNNNGTFEAAFDPAVGTQNTKSGGQYLFTNLAPGSYFVEIAPLAGSKSSTGAPGQATGPYEPGIITFTDNEDHGTQAGAVIRSGLVNLQLGANPASTPIFGDTTGAGNRNYTIDFGVFTSLAIGDFVWNDLDNDGAFDVGEPALPNVKVELLLGGNVVGTTSTDGNGKYLFSDLSAGTYTVRITAPTGFISSSGKNGSTTGPSEPVIGNPGDNKDNGTATGGFIITNPFVLLAAGNPDNGGTANLQQDFGLFQPLALGDTVWIDANNNGLLDGGEKGLANVPVTLLDSTGTVTIGSTTTDANGVYGFSNLTQGTYVISIAPGNGYISSTGKNGSAAGSHEPGVSGTQNNEDHGTQFDAANIRTTVTLTAAGTNPDGDANLRQDFGVFQPLSLGNFIFEDANNNGTFDAGDSKMANVTVSLLDSTSTVIGTTASDANGNYGFTNLIPGSYTVRVTAPVGYTTSTGKNGSAIGPYEPGVSGTQDNEDHGTLIGTFVTSGVTLAAPGDAANPDAAGFANLRQDFGLFQPISVGSFVWIDTNDNGKFDTGEAPVPNVPVQILDGGNNVIASTTTDSNGAYNFTNLSPGTYFISIAPPAGATPSSSSTPPLSSPDNQNVGTAGPNGTIISPAVQLNLGAGPLVGGNTDTNAFITFDFGLQLALGTISGFTYFDPNINGAFTPGVNGDAPIGGVTVTLTGVDAGGNPLPSQTTVTDKNGFYQFVNLPQGKYTVTETQPAGYYYDGLDTPGSSVGSTTPNNDVILVPLAAGENSINNNFGEIPYGGTQGYVWIDLNNNCQKDPGEGGLPNVPVTISGTAFPGTPLSQPLTTALLPPGYSLTVLTDASGFYSFPVLPPGTYSIARGDLPPEARNFYANGCMQNGDPNPNPPTAGNQVFNNVTLGTPIRGPFNFGVIPIDPNDPSKRNFLGSSGNTGTVPNPNLPTVGGPTRGPAPMNPAFTVTTGVPTGNALVIIATGVGQRAVVRVFDYAVGGEKYRFEPYGAYTGGVRVAQGDVDGDGVQDILTSTGQGGGPRIRVYSGATGATLKDFFAYEPEFRGGVFVAAGDVDGDGKAEIITGTEIGGGPRVRVFNGVTNVVMQDFFAFDADQRGGVRVAAADFDGDAKADIVTTTGAGVPTRVRVFKGNAPNLNGNTISGQPVNGILQDYFAFGSTFTLGATLGVGDINGDGQADILVGTEAGGGPRVQVYDGSTQAVIKDFFAFDSNLRSGVRVAARDINGDNKAEIIVTAGNTGAARVRMLDAASLVAYEDFFAMDPDFRGGAYVG